MHAQFCSTNCNHADIKDSDGQTAADVTKRNGDVALADYVEEFQSGSRGELAISSSAVIHSSSCMHGHR